jgi:RDD family protein
MTSDNPGAMTALWVAYGLSIAFVIWNLYRQGKIGSSIGKSALGFKVVSIKDGQPIGF